MYEHTPSATPTGHTKNTPTTTRRRTRLLRPAALTTGAITGLTAAGMVIWAYDLDDPDDFLLAGLVTLLGLLATGLTAILYQALAHVAYLASALLLAMSNEVEQRRR